MGAVWEFIKRHKGKIITGTILVGGAAVAITQSKSTSKPSLLNGDLANDYLKIQARRHYVFDTNHRSCDQSIIDLVPTFKSLIEKRFDIDELVHKLQERSEDLTSQEKLEIWKKIRLYAIARLVAVAFSYSYLTLALKAQISILAAEMCTKMEQPSNSEGWSSYLPSQFKSWFGGETTNVMIPHSQSVASTDAGSRQIFLQCLQYFTTQGMMQMFDLIENVTTQQAEEVSLKREMNGDDFRGVLDMIEQRMTSLVTEKFPDLVAPISDNEVQSGDNVLRLLGQLLESLRSPMCVSTLSSLVDNYFATTCAKLPTEREPLATLLPSVTSVFGAVGSNSFDSPLQTTLCSSELHQFASQVFNSDRRTSG